MTIRCAIDGRRSGMGDFIDAGMTALATNLAVVGRFKQIVIDIKQTLALLCRIITTIFYPAKPRILVTHGATALDLGKGNRGQEQK